MEGKTDKKLFEWFLDRSGLYHAKVFTIDSVEVAPSIVSELGLSDGNKQRLVALAVKFNEAHGPTAFQVTCIVDTDEDRILLRVLDIPHLLWTDYSCIEAYSFDRVHFTKFLHLVLGCQSNTEQLLRHYGHVLKDLFLIRAALLRCSVPARWISFVDCCRRVGDEINFSSDGFIQRLLDASGQRREEARLLRTIEELRARVDEDARHQLNGHDLFELLHWDKREDAHRSHLRNEEAVGTALMACLEFDLLRDLPLFKILSSRLS